MPSFEYLSVDQALPALLAVLQQDGAEVGSRQGDRTLEILMPQITLLEPLNREVLVPGRKASLPAQIAETMWVLKGRNDVEFLSHYLPRAKDFSDDGETWRGGYGPRIRQWPLWDGGTVDQLAHVVRLLQDPKERGGRRAVINIYDPAVDTQPGKDIPCNNWLSFISRNGELHLNVATRSNDVFWGWSGINAFEWSALLEIVAHLAGMKVGTVTFNVTSFHLYDRHWKRADEIVKIDNNSPAFAFHGLATSPRFDLDPVNRNIEALDGLFQDWFRIEEGLRTDQTWAYDEATRFPEPMFRSWLLVLATYWTGNDTWIREFQGTRLHEAYTMSPKRRDPLPEPRSNHMPNPAVDVKVDDRNVIGYLVQPATEDQPWPPKAGDQVIVTPVKETGEVTLDISIDTSKFVEGISVAGRNLREALKSTRGAEKPLASKPAFVEFVDELHREKGKVYGDSWKKRGEQMSIMSNLGRKIDRLGVAGAGDTAADTLIDLLVYALKYEQWLQQTWRDIDKRSHPSFFTDEFEHVRHRLNDLTRTEPMHSSEQDVATRIDTAKELFESLEQVVTEMPPTDATAIAKRLSLVLDLERALFPAARFLWEQEQVPLSDPANVPTHRDMLRRDVDAVKRVDEKTQKANKTRFFNGYNDTEEN